MRSSRDLRPLQSIVSPFWLGALALLLLNDHLFKGSGLLPGWLTGKLSDFAGLIVAPPLVAIALRARTRHAIALAHAGVGFAFAALELSPELTHAANAIYHLGGAAWRSTSDPTDLVALLVLPLGHLLTVRTASRLEAPARRRLEGAIALAGVISCAASTGTKADQPGPCAGPDCDFDGYDATVDCNDYDSTIHPGAGCPNPKGESVCDDGVDNDNDHLIDCDDPDCELACKDLDQACASGSTRHFDDVAFLTGSTLTGTSVTDGSCVGADSPEVIFQGDVLKAGVLTFGIPKDHGLHVRRQCFDAYTELACSIERNGTVDVAIGEPGPITVVVEALDPFHPSAFTVPVSFRAIGCGDGIRQANEDCDDGNNVSGDGCSASCSIEYDVLCAQYPLVAAGSHNGGFEAGTKAFVGSCGGSLDLPEQGFQYVPAGASVTLSLTATAGVTLYATTGCGEFSAPLGCAQLPPGGGTTSLDLTTATGETVTVFVELAPDSPAGTTFALDIAEP